MQSSNDVDHESDDLDRKPAARILTKKPQEAQSETNGNSTIINGEFVETPLETNFAGVSSMDIYNTEYSTRIPKSITENLVRTAASISKSLPLEASQIDKLTQIIERRIRLLSGSIYDDGNKSGAGGAGSKKCVDSIPNLVDVNQEYNRTRPNENLPLVDATLPLKLGSLAKRERYKDYTIWNTTPEEAKSNQREHFFRSGFTAFKLHELEESTRQWYLNTVKARHNGQGKFSPPANKASATFFSLKFNEGSLSTISKWSCRNRIDDLASSDVNLHAQPQEKRIDSFPNLLNQQNLSPIVDLTKKNVSLNTKQVLKQPTVDARFRKCCICNLWGHYEIECPNLPYKEILRFGNDLKSLVKISDTLTEEDSRSNLDKITTIDNRFPVVHSIEGNAKNLTQDKKAMSIEHPVIVEFFHGFLFEQREIPENDLDFQVAEVETLQHVVSNYDDSFQVDGFQVKASTSLKGLENGPPEVEKVSLASKRVKTKNSKDEVEIKHQGKAMSEEMKFQKKKVPTFDYFHLGDVVAWSPETVNGEISNGDIYTGIIVNIPENIEVDDLGMRSKKVMIGAEFLASIPASPDLNVLGIKGFSTAIASAGNPSKAEVLLKNTPTFNDQAATTRTSKDPNRIIPPFGTLIWVLEERLYLVNEECDTFMPEKLRVKKRKYTIRQKSEIPEQKRLSIKNSNLAANDFDESNSNDLLKKSQFSAWEESPEGHKRKKLITSFASGSSRPRTMNYSERFKETGRLISNDMSLAPRKPARKLDDGTFALPQGRRPVGLEWDHDRGVWALPVKKKKSKKRKPITA